MRKTGKFISIIFIFVLLLLSLQIPVSASINDEMEKHRLLLLLAFIIIIIVTILLYTVILPKVIYPIIGYIIVAPIYLLCLIIDFVRTIIYRRFYKKADLYHYIPDNGNLEVAHFLMNRFNPSYKESGIIKATLLNLIYDGLIKPVSVKTTDNNGVTHNEISLKLKKLPTKNQKSALYGILFSLWQQSVAPVTEDYLCYAIDIFYDYTPEVYEVLNKTFGEEILLDEYDGNIHKFLEDNYDGDLYKFLKFYFTYMDAEENYPEEDIAFLYENSFEKPLDNDKLYEYLYSDCSTENFPAKEDFFSMIETCKNNDGEVSASKLYNKLISYMCKDNIVVDQSAMKKYPYDTGRNISELLNTTAKNAQKTFEDMGGFKANYRFTIMKNLTETGKKYLSQLIGLKKFLVHPSLTSEIGLYETEIWKDYMIYAVLFGVSDKVIKQLESVYPDTHEELCKIKQYCDITNTYCDIIMKSHKMYKKKSDN